MRYPEEGNALRDVLQRIIYALKLAVRWLREKIARTAIELPPGEVVEHAGWANIFPNVARGKLYLTNRNLIFRDSFNLHEVHIPLSQIAGVAKSMTMGIVPNSLTVTQRDGTAHEFVVTGRDVWLRMIMARRPSGT